MGSASLPLMDALFTLHVNLCPFTGSKAPPWLSPLGVRGVQPEEGQGGTISTQTPTREQDRAWLAGHRVLSHSAYGGTTNRSIPRGGHTLIDSVEVCNHLLLGKRFEGIKAEATSFKGWASVSGDQLVIEFRGNRKFYKSYG